MSKQLKNKAIQIKGKDYVLVSDRIIYFNEKYPEGSIITKMISNPGDERVVFKATIKPDKDGTRRFTGYSQATWGDGYINRGSALENAETSAVGRALGMMGIGVIDSVASADELNKASFEEQANMYQVTEIKKLTTDEQLKKLIDKFGKIEELSKPRAQYILNEIRKKKASRN